MGAMPADPFDDLDPTSIKAVVQYATDLIRRNEWNEDIAQVLTQQVVQHHGTEGVDAFLDAVGAELAKREHPSV